MPDKTTISSNNLTALLVEENGNIWIGTKGNGMDYFDRAKNNFEHYTTTEGLCSNAIFNLVKDEKGRLWIGTGNGLSCFDPATERFTNFSRTDGLVNAEFNRYSASKLSNGYILMGGMDGIDYFHPDSVLGSRIPPQVQITGLKVFDKDLFPFSDISLSHDQNYISIEFAAMDFRNPAANKFAYQLKGINKDWVIAGNDHSISYANLEPGRYHFFVKAAGSDGVWNENPAEIYFTILTPWWRTWWFYCLCGLSLAAILFAFYKFRIGQVKKLLQLRTKISQDLHDDVGAALSGIKVFSQLAKDRPASSAAYLDKISNYSDEMLNKMGDIVWSLNNENDSFEHLIGKLRSYAEAVTAAKNIWLVFEVNPKFERIGLNIILRKNIYMITREAINNAVKYAECRSIQVLLKFKDAGAELVIADDGKGFNKDNMTTGNGLINMRKRAEEMRGQFTVETVPQKGTEIRVLFNFT